MDLLITLKKVLIDHFFLFGFDFFNLDTLDIFYFDFNISFLVAPKEHLSPIKL